MADRTSPPPRRTPRTVAAVAAGVFGASLLAAPSAPATRLARAGAAPAITTNTSVGAVSRAGTTVWVASPLRSKSSGHGRPHKPVRHKHGKRKKAGKKTAGKKAVIVATYPKRRSNV